MDTLASPSNSSDPLVAALNACTRREDVRALREAYGETRLRQAWTKLDRLTRSSLLLTREFDGTIVGQLELVRDEQDALVGDEDLQRRSASVHATAGRDQDRASETRLPR